MTNLGGAKIGHVVSLKTRKKIGKANKNKHASLATEFKRGHKDLISNKLTCLFLIAGNFGI